MVLVRRSKAAGVVITDADFHRWQAFRGTSLRTHQRFALRNHFAQFMAQHGRQLCFGRTLVDESRGQIDFGGADVEDLRLGRANSAEQWPNTELLVGSEKLA